MVFSPYNEYWRHLRKITVMELLSVNRVWSFRSIREEEVWDLIEFIASSEGLSINLSDKIYTMTSDFRGSICEHKMKRKASNNTNGDERDLVGMLLNYEEANKPEFHLTTNQIKVVAMGRPDIYFAGTESFATTIEWELSELLRNLRVMEKAQSEDIFSAGSETSATTVEWAMSELLKNPRVMEKVQSEVRQVFEGKNKIEEEDVQKLHYLKLVMKETFRLHPPGPLIPREARERCEIGGYTIPAKAKILINAYAIGRDPKLWADPECFQPERFQGSSIDFKGNNFELLPFGAGRRIFPGISFATSNIELGLAQLLYHFNWNLPNGTKLEALDMADNFGITARRKNNLHLIATTYIPFNK
ncbi:cytochrome P450 71D8-like [Prunus dulcis]|uniref:cytochrome P450 71D8-like n=2 Tax=Prunus dulcis TaxID=3755 RepID=UPI001483BF8C|nr:cytochrome P450 71D8-like [Prunus dulcis]